MAVICSTTRSPPPGPARYRTSRLLLRLVALGLSPSSPDTADLAASSIRASAACNIERSGVLDDLALGGGVDGLRQRVVGR